MTTLLIQQVLIMFLLASIGYICFRTKKITMEGCRTISNILLYLSLPCVIINSFLVEFSKVKLMFNCHLEFQLKKVILSEHLN